MYLNIVIYSCVLSGAQINYQVCFLFFNFNLIFSNFYFYYYFFFEIIIIICKICKLNVFTFLIHSV